MGDVTLPTPGGDRGTWGTELNTFLTENVFNASGYLKDPVEIEQYLRHKDDADTQIDFTDDQISVLVGNVEMLRLVEDGTQDKFWVNPAAADVDFIIGANAVFVRGDTGDVTIGGGASGGSRLEVKDTQHPTIKIWSETASQQARIDLTAGAGGYGNIFNTVGDLVLSNQDATGKLQLRTNSTTRVTVLPSGYVGISEDTPTERLHVAGPGEDITAKIAGEAGYQAGVRLVAGAGSFGNIRNDIGNLYIQNTDAAGAMHLRTDTLDRLVISSSGVVTISDAGLVLPTVTSPTPNTEGAICVDTDLGANGSLMVYANGAWRTAVTL